MTTKSTEAAAPTAINQVQGRTMDDIRERIVRAETKHENLKEQFFSHKDETKEQFAVVNKKLDQVVTVVGDIRMTIAKWLGGGAVLMFLAELLVKKFLG